MISIVLILMVAGYVISNICAYKSGYYRGRIDQSLESEAENIEAERERRLKKDPAT